MTTNQLISKARRALETGQPNLASLYMRKALEQTEQHRRELNPLAAQVRQMRQAFGALIAALRPVARQYIDALETLHKLAEAPNPQKSHFALVGPSK